MVTFQSFQFHKTVYTQANMSTTHNHNDFVVSVFVKVSNSFAITGSMLKSVYPSLPLPSVVNILLAVNHVLKAFFV